MAAGEGRVGVAPQTDSKGPAGGFRRRSGLGTNRRQGGFQACEWAQGHSATPPAPGREGGEGRPIPFCAQQEQLCHVPRCGCGGHRSQDASPRMGENWQEMRFGDPERSQVGRRKPCEDRVLGGREDQHITPPPQASLHRKGHSGSGRPVGNTCAQSSASVFPPGLWGLSRHRPLPVRGRPPWRWACRTGDPALAPAGSPSPDSRAPPRGLCRSLSLPGV